MDVSRLVQQYLAPGCLVVVLTDDDAAHPAEGSDIAGMAVDAHPLFLLLPDGTAPQGRLQAEHLPEPRRQTYCHTYYIYKAGEQEEAEAGCSVTCAVLCKYLHLGQHVDGDAEVEHLQLCCLYYGLMVERHAGDIAQWQDEREEQDAEQYHAVEAEEACTLQYQHVWQVEHCQRQSGLDGIQEQCRHEISGIEALDDSVHVRRPAD